jgi:hypothetical protein
MTIARRLIGKWKATTDGEKLFHFLVKNVGEFRALEHLHEVSVSDVIRGREFMRFTEGTIVLHCFGRLLQAAKWYRVEYNDDPQRARKAIENFAIDTLGIAKATCSSFSELAPLALAAATAASESSKTPNPSVKSKVIKNCNNKFNCYSCGIDLDLQAPSDIIDNDSGKLIPNPHYLEHEHLWPHSFGGNSVAENLLPSCPYCNRAKANIASWEWSPLQSFLPKFEGKSESINASDHNGQLKIGLHIRVATAYARINGTTLKNAYGSIGPRIQDIYLVDSNDTADFFNLRVHDFEETGIYLEDY